jgi:hypothetical protein
MINYPAGAKHDSSAPWNEVEGDNECMYCGDLTENKHYCSKVCEKADMSD